MSPFSKTIWVTRACPGARVTAERVRALGFEALAAPLLEVRPLAGGPIDLAGVG
ncbi:MAG: uroporphyrinogen-III synthase, partial [Caulobacteraceae bacterium]|nr:uroporphyrinogen-III synthase [Caulobacteraceae bacterium]